MHFAPSEALRIAVLLHFPFAFAVQLAAGAVDDQMQRLATAQGGQGCRSVRARPLRVE
jgi:hypothetical protein